MPVPSRRQLLPLPQPAEAGELCCVIVLSVPGLTARAADYTTDIAVDFGDNLVSVDTQGAWLIVRLRWPREGDERLMSAWLERLSRLLSFPVLISVEPDAVALPEAAVLLGLPLACLLEGDHENGFPSPLPHQPDSWKLTELISWMQAIGAFSVCPQLAALAKSTASANELMRGRHLGCVRLIFWFTQGFPGDQYETPA